MNTSNTANHLPYALEDPQNYNYVFPHTVTECFTTHVETINTYIAQFKQSPWLHTLRKPVYDYLLAKGLCTMNHIFNIMLLYTKNLELTNHYSTHTIGYYVEFIEQNMQHEDKDKIDYNNASRFCYAKTIDKLQKYCRKTSYTELDDNTAELLYRVEEKEAEVFKTIHVLSEIYKNFVVRASALPAEKAPALPAEKAPALPAEDTTIIAQHIINLINTGENLLQVLQVLLAFINIFPPTDRTALPYCYRLCTQLRSNVPNINTVRKKLASPDQHSHFRRDTVDDYIAWLLTA